MAKPRAFKDFIVELRDYDQAADSYTVALAPAQGWGDPAAVKVKLDPPGIQKSLDRLEAKKIFVDDLIPLGQQLMDRLLPDGDLRALFVNAVKTAGPDQGVRLRLVIQDTGLAQLPWEYSYLKIQAGAEDRTHFLVIHPKISLVRHTPINAPLPDLAFSDPKDLRLLAVMANPASPDFRELDLDTEERVIEKALGDFNVDGAVIHWQPVRTDVTPAGLSQALLDKPQLFHFSGHGQFKPLDDFASLVLLKDDGSKEPELVPAADIARKLQTAGVRLAYLGACESGRQRGLTPWTGIAPALAAAGIPAVVAMQYELLDDMAILFAQAFYTSLGAGLSVDEAVTVGRLAVLDKSSDKGVEWGVPTLYLRSPDGVLFPEVTGQPSATADGIRASVKAIIDTIESGGTVIGMRFKKTPGSGTFSVEHTVKVVKGNVIGMEFDDFNING